MNEVISTTIKITSPKMPPNVSFIENEFKKLNYNVVRWAIIEAQKNELTLSISYMIS